MNGAIGPALVAVTGGSALMGAIYLHEHRRDAAMRESRVALAVRFPAAIEPSAAQSALAGLSGLSHVQELVTEVAATQAGITHRLLVPADVRDGLLRTLASALPGIRTSERDHPTGRATLALRIFVPTPALLRTDEAEAASRSLLHSLAALDASEQVVIRWALRPDEARPWSAPEKPNADDRLIERAWRTKTAGPGFQAHGLVLVQAPTIARARILANQVVSLLRSRRTTARTALRESGEHGNRSLASLPQVRRTSGWLSVAELLPLLAWPLGDQLVPGLEVGGARELAVPQGAPTEGRRLFIGRDARGDRPVALSAEAARHHVALVGPSGVGKSVMLARGVLDDLAAGYGGAVIDPKSDLIETILARIPERDADRVVVLDPAAPGPVPGLNILRAGDPDLAADVVLGALRSLFPNWGIRSEIYGRLALRTLIEMPGATLADMGRLFLDPAFRMDGVARLRDPLLVGAWQSFEQLSAAEQMTHVQAPMARVMALVGRPSLRAVLAQPEPKLDVGRHLAERKWLLVSLAPGRLGEPASRLLGAVVLYVLWSAVEARAALPESARPPVFLYVDELATIADLPFGFELLAERARGLGAGLTIATQTTKRLPDSLRAALMGNVSTLVSFRAGAQEATLLARELPGLEAHDLQTLGRFEVAARVGTGTGSGIAVMTGRTEPLPPETGQAGRIRAASAERYGQTVAAEPLSAADSPPTDAGLDSWGRTGRRS
jgi:hypothetical protein